MAMDNSPRGQTTWTFLSNHAHTLICLHFDPQMRLRDVAQKVGITERAAQRIVQELEKAGIVTRTRVGRRNTYTIHGQQRLRHPLESHCTIDQLLKMVDSNPPQPKPAAPNTPESPETPETDPPPT